MYKAVVHCNLYIAGEQDCRHQSIFTGGLFIPCIQKFSLLQNLVILLEAVRYSLPNCLPEGFSYLDYIGLTVERLYLANKTKFCFFPHPATSQAWRWKPEWQAQIQHAHCMYHVFIWQTDATGYWRMCIHLCFCWFCIVDFYWYKIPK